MIFKIGIPRSVEHKHLRLYFSIRLRLPGSGGFFRYSVIGSEGKSGVEVEDKEAETARNSRDGWQVGDAKRSTTKPSLSAPPEKPCTYITDSKALNEHSDTRF